MRLCSEENDKRYFSFFENGGEGGIASLSRRYAEMSLRGCFLLSMRSTTAFKPLALWAGFSSQPLKRQHPNPLETNWGVGGEGGIRTHGSLRYFSFQD